MLKVRWVMLFGLCSKFHELSIKNRLRFDKVTESLKVGTFLRHSVFTQYSMQFVLHSAMRFVYAVNVYPRYSCV